MNSDAPKREEFVPPMSSYSGPVADLIGCRLLSPPPRPGVLATLDQFEILSVLGGGGMGIVLLARDTNTNENFAVKMIKLELVADTQVVHRFVKEAEHMHRLRHPNVLPVLEVSDRPEGPYFVMPFFERGNLAKCIRPGRPLETALILDVVSQIAEALRYTHQHGIIHRDLKPANILLAANERICLADFGLARTMFNDTIVDVESRHCEGTAPYMSPAVAAGEAEDTRCDIYAFGALLYEMLTGQPPYTGRTTKEFQKKILAGPPQPISAVNPRADGRLIKVADGAMARELRDRYADMADILADLERIKVGKPPLGPRGKGAMARLELRRFLNIPKIALIPFCLAILVALGLLLKPTAAKTPLTFQTPRGIVADGSRNVFLVDSDACTIDKITSVGAVTTFAGAAGMPGIADGTGKVARFSILRGVAIDSVGDLYVADTCTIRKITPAGVVSLFAGKPGIPGAADGVHDKARFSMPCGIAVDRDGNVYVADMYTIRKIAAAGTVSTLAGTVRHAGSADGAAANARFGDQEKGVAVDDTGNVYIADAGNDSIRRITKAGIVSTIAGMPGQSGSTEGVGINARFNHPRGIAVDNAGNVFVADTANDTIRKISPAGEVSTLAGATGQRGNIDGAGPDARFSHPQAIAVDTRGTLYVTDTGNHTIRRVTARGVVSTMTGLQGALDSPPKR